MRAASALNEAMQILPEQQPSTCNNGGSLCLWGAVHKKLFEITKDPTQLDVAIAAYERGSYLLGDRYNGINLACLLEVCASLANNHADAITDYVMAWRSTDTLVGDSAYAHDQSERQERDCNLHARPEVSNRAGPGRRRVAARSVGIALS